jgi:hypothetical protein
LLAHAHSPEGGDQPDHSSIPGSKHGLGSESFEAQSSERPITSSHDDKSKNLAAAAAATAAKQLSTSWGSSEIDDASRSLGMLAAQTHNHRDNGYDSQLEFRAATATLSDDDAGSREGTQESGGLNMHAYREHNVGVA